jgi:multidrug efflux pump subunit AcrB
LPDQTGLHAPFAALASVRPQIAPQELHREDQQYLRLISYEYTGSTRFGQQHLDRTLANFRPSLPLGFTAQEQSFGFFKNTTSRKITGYFWVVGLLIFWIGAVLFNSLRQALQLLLLIPLSYIGIFLTFYWFSFPFDQGGYAGFLLVSGLVVNALIFVINDYNHLRRQRPGLSPVRVYVRALSGKFLPILLTQLSTIAGLLPFLLAGPEEVFWFAFSASALGGLLCSLVVMSIVSPMLLEAR